MESRHIAYGGIAAVGGFLAVRKSVQRIAFRRMASQRGALVRTAIYLAAFGEYPSTAEVGEAEMKAAAKKLSETFVPVVGWSFPSEAEIENHIGTTALAAATKPANLLRGGQLLIPHLVQTLQEGRGRLGLE
jgi:hypothetical protein